MSNSLKQVEKELGYINQDLQQSIFEGGISLEMLVATQDNLQKVIDSLQNKPAYPETNLLDKIERGDISKELIDKHPELMGEHIKIDKHMDLEEYILYSDKFYCWNCKYRHKLYRHPANIIFKGTEFSGLAYCNGIRKDKLPIIEDKFGKCEGWEFSEENYNQFIIDKE